MYRKHVSQGAPPSPGPHPRQYRLRPKLSRRLALWGSIGISLFAIGYQLSPIIAGMIERSTFFADVEHRRAMGEKILASDFVTLAPPDDQNAATYIRKAIDQLPLDVHQQQLIDDVGSFHPSNEAKSFVRQYDNAHPNIKALLQRAEACSQVDWHVNWSSPAAQMMEPYLKGQRDLASFLYAVGICQHESGNDAAAMQTARDLLFLARALDTRSTSNAHLVAACPERFGANLCLKLAAPVTARRKEYLAPMALPLIADLCDDKSIRSQFEAAITAERMASVDLITHLPISKSQAFIFQYQTFAAANGSLKYFDGPIRAAALPSWPAATPLVPEEPPNSKLLLAPIMAPYLRASFLAEFKSEAERHAAAIAIACRIYADDHDGKWPADLSALVPHYLSAIPCDPFDAQLRPMKYLRGTPPAVYSISINGIDNKGDRTGEFSYHDGVSYNPWWSPDAVFPIGGVVEPADKRRPEEP